MTVLQFLPSLVQLRMRRFKNLSFVGQQQEEVNFSLVVRIVSEAILQIGVHFSQALRQSYLFISRNMQAVWSVWSQNPTLCVCTSVRGRTDCMLVFGVLQSGVRHYIKFSIQSEY